jgi:hypothetical protein
MGPSETMERLPTVGAVLYGLLYIEWRMKMHDTVEAAAECKPKRYIAIHGLSDVSSWHTQARTRASASCSNIDMHSLSMYHFSYISPIA